jgi:hypothetical protein
MTESDEAEHDSRHDAVESLMWDVAARVLTLGVDVILDFGCWVRSQRDEYHPRAKDLGADFEIHFVDAPYEVLLERIRSRNNMASEGTFFIPESKLKEWVHIFEPPSSEELACAKDL